MTRFRIVVMLRIHSSLSTELNHGQIGTSNAYGALCDCKVPS